MKRTPPKHFYGSPEQWTQIRERHARERALDEKVARERAVAERSAKEAKR